MENLSMHICFQYRWLLQSKLEAATKAQNRPTPNWMGGKDPGGGGWWGYAFVFIIRPILAVAFVFSIILLSWLVAWKTVLVHVPLVQEIFGLRKKPVKPKPPTHHRLSRFYNSNSALRLKWGSKAQFRVE